MMKSIKYHNPFELGKYIRSLITDNSKNYCVFLDEIQKVATIQNPYINGVEDKIGFVDVVLITGSNSRMLSSGTYRIQRARRRNTCEEFYNAYKGDKSQAWQEYCTYCGMLLEMAKNYV